MPWLKSESSVSHCWATSKKRHVNMQRQTVKKPDCVVRSFACPFNRLFVLKINSRVFGFEVVHRYFNGTSPILHPPQLSPWFKSQIQGSEACWPSNQAGGCCLPKQFQMQNQSPGSGKGRYFKDFSGELFPAWRCCWELLSGANLTGSSNRLLRNECI